ncbi:MAG: hypothetical protein JXR42_04925 [Gammaproteobacteria bacterium]|nr:hypothetical protein [Gammaproteobacteria bacterium]
MSYERLTTDEKKLRLSDKKGMKRSATYPGKGVRDRWKEQVIIGKDTTRTESCARLESIDEETGVALKEEDISKPDLSEKRRNLRRSFRTTNLAALALAGREPGELSDSESSSDSEGEKMDGFQSPKGM